MHLYYLPLPLAEFPSRWAHSLEHIKMCEAFARQGVRVRFILHALPFGGASRRLRDSLQPFYGVATVFPVTTLPGLKLRRRNVLRGLRADSLSMSASALGYLWWNLLHGRLGPDDVVYCRNRFVAMVAASTLASSVAPQRRPTIIYEIHEPEDRPFRILARSAAGFVTISHALALHLTEEHGVLPERITIEPCAVDTAWLSQRTLSKEEARRRLGLPPNGAPIIAYCGRIDTSRGVDVLLDATRNFAERGWICLVVGGTADDALKLPGVREIPSSVHFAGRVPPSRVREYLAAADVLVAPQPRRSHYDVGSSPLKLFEYMAADRPILTTRVPAVQEILRDGQEAVLVEPRSAEALCDGIEWILNHPVDAQRIASGALALARTHTWDERAHRILEFIGRLRHHGRHASGHVMDAYRPAAVDP